MRPILPIIVVVASSLLAGCNLPGTESTQAINDRREADGKAIGGACRHAGRAIEDCYALNRKADRSAMFAGWREMNDYMRENKIDAVSPQLVAEVAVAAKAAEKAADEPAEPKKPAAKAAPKKHD